MTYIKKIVNIFKILNIYSFLRERERQREREYEWGGTDREGDTESKASFRL